MTTASKITMVRVVLIPFFIVFLLLSGNGGARVVEDGRQTPKLLEQTSNMRYESLIGPDCTDCFSVDRLTLCGGSAVLHAGAGVHIVSSGAGAVRCGDFAHALKKGDYFFLPACAAGEAIVEGELELLICRGGIEP